MPRERVVHGKVWKHTPSTSKDGELQGISRVEYHGNVNLEEGEYLTVDPSLEINWSREYGHVQASIDFSREQWLECAKDLEDNPDTIRKAIYTDGLTRKEINDMIRILRRARDAAFGKDE